MRRWTSGRVRQQGWLLSLRFRNRRRRQRRRLVAAMLLVAGLRAPNWCRDGRYGEYRRRRPRLPAGAVRCVSWSRSSEGERMAREARPGIRPGVSVSPIWPAWRLTRRAAPERPWRRGKSRQAGPTRLPACRGTRSHDRARERWQEPAGADRAIPPSISAAWDLLSDIRPRALWNQPGAYARVSARCCANLT